MTEDQKAREGLVRRLRSRGRNNVTFHDINRAADEIARLTAEVEGLKDEIARLTTASAALAAADGEYIHHLTAEVERLTRHKDGLIKHLTFCEQIAGKALGYPWFKDDQKNFPGTTEVDGVCVGEHFGETIVEELANSHAALTRRIAVLEEAVKNIAIEAEREKGNWIHLKRVIALNARAALTPEGEG